MELKYIQKVAEKTIYNYSPTRGNVELWDFSKSNLNQEAREEAVAMVASLSYGNEMAKNPKKLWNYLVEQGHTSVFEFIRFLEGDENSGYWGCSIKESLRNDSFLTYEECVFEEDEINEWIEAHKKSIAVFKVKIPLFVRSQYHRHRGFSYLEMCISEDTLIQTSKGKRTIKSLYEQQYKKYCNGRLPRVKVYDIDKGVFVYAPIKEVFKTGEKEVYEVIVKVGTNKEYKIVTTMEHKFLTKSGWKRLKKLSVGDFVAVNGELLYRNKEWLKKVKYEYLSQGRGLQDIANDYGFNYNTLRKWIRIHGLQYTHKEQAMFRRIWNKGLKGEKSHSFGRKKSNEERLKISQKLSKPTTETKRGFRQRVCNYWMAEFRRKKILEKYNYRCAYCGNHKDLVIDHIKPVALYPELAFDENNVQILCEDCHKKKTLEEVALMKKTVRYAQIISIKRVGIVETYDMEVDHPSHNYVANGFVVHNSRRYVKPDKVKFEYWLPEGIKLTTKFNSFVGLDLIIEDFLQIAEHLYKELLRKGYKPEVARAFIPQALYTKFWVMMDYKNARNYFVERYSKYAQEQIRELTEAELKLLYKHQPEFLGQYVKVVGDEKLGLYGKGEFVVKILDIQRLYENLQSNGWNSDARIIYVEFGDRNYYAKFDIKLGLFVGKILKEKFE